MESNWWCEKVTMAAVMFHSDVIYSPLILMKAPNKVAGALDRSTRRLLTPGVVPQHSMILRADISQYYAIKAAFEQIFGNEAWLDLKECTAIATWKKYATRLLRAMKLAVEETIHVRDEAWFGEICECIGHGLRITEDVKSVDELLSGLSATLVRLVFLQIGMFPNQSKSRKVTLARDNWRLDAFRTVQYIQSARQLERVFWRKQQAAMGFEEQMKLWEQYRASKNKAPYSKWCAEHKFVFRAS
jgi:hypothetical protein